MAKLYFYYASMNAGKSSTLLQAAFNYGERGMQVMLWTAAIDDRPGFGAISSRIGLAGDASRFESDTDIESAVLAKHPSNKSWLSILLSGITSSRIFSKASM